MSDLVHGASSADASNNTMMMMEDAFSSSSSSSAYYHNNNNNNGHMLKPTNDIQSRLGKVLYCNNHNNSNINKRPAAPPLCLLPPPSDRYQRI